MEQKLLPMEQQYEFYGRHLLLNFSGCLVDLNDLDMLERDMKYAIETIGATILSQVKHRFDPTGGSILFLLAESHASIHTYPEHNACFLDVFTCGREIDVLPFGTILERLWEPGHVSRHMHERFDPKHACLPQVLAV
jgi:S-adenosylmethionine decarboxylase